MIYNTKESSCLSIKVLYPNDISLKIFKAKNKFYWKFLTDRFWKTVLMLTIVFGMYCWVNLR